MDTQDIQQKLVTLERAHKRVIIWAVIVFLAIVLIIVLFLRQQATSGIDIRVQALQDSMKVHDKVFKAQIVTLQHIHDSAIDAIQQQQNDLQQQVTSINNRYDKERKQLTNSSADNRLKFFSGHLPKAGTSR